MIFYSLVFYVTGNQDQLETAPASAAVPVTPKVNNYTLFKLLFNIKLIFPGR